MNAISVLLCLALHSLGNAPPILVSPQSIDLRVEHGTFADPEPSGYYSYYVYNDSDDVAPNVTLSSDIPAGALFGRVRVDDARARCDAPTSGNRGHVEIRIPGLLAHSFAKVDFDLEYDGEQGTDASMRLDAVSDALDPNPDNNSYTYENRVTYPPSAPVLTGVTSYHDPNNGFVVIITGEGLSPLTNEVGIGCMCAPWNNVIGRNPSTLELRGGKELRKQFPKGVPVQICIQTPNAPTSYITYTRR